jgi:hypothetical protein
MMMMGVYVLLMVHVLRLEHCLELNEDCGRSIICLMMIS